MGEVLNQMLENYLVSSNVQLQKGPDSLSFTINSAEGISKTTLFNILPYMHLIFFDIHARSLPGEIAENAVYHPMQFNYCVDGRIEMLLDDNSYIYLKEKDFCISRQTSQSESYFPTKYYHGITLYFDPDFFTEANANVNYLFNLNLSQLSEIYFEKKDTYIAEASSEMEKILDRLWQLYETPSSFYMKLCVLELLHFLLDTRNVAQEKVLTFYTSTQVAQQFGVSETSLKNYFRGVYGKNISDYLRDLRMYTAEKLLIDTKMPISEIASQVGYTKQGKFAEVFRQRFQMNPLEYRRSKMLEKF